MAINFQHARQLLQQSNFRQLFAEELNWATPSARPISVDADGETFAATPIAEQGGMMVFEITSRKDGLIPGRSVQLKLHRRIAQTYAEHILVFVNTPRSSSLWVWVKRQEGRLQTHDHWYHASQPGDSLLQKLNGIAFTYDQLDEDGRIAIGPVLDAVEASFRAERVTKRFYEQFEKEHAAFLKFVSGIPDEAMEKWYVSVMLNRLMFIYFIQRKRFLSGDRDYLRHKLGEGEYPQGFYRGFLCPLFFRGFALKDAERSEADRELLGPVPYLNGGIFQQHEIERQYGKVIEIPDKAFGRLFDFFDRWHWQLDERPLRRDDEINPDVLGYIFEKYINRKQMGAYYTKEDITGYISRNTILPFLLDTTREKCRAAFESGTGVSPVWSLLRDDPDRYIYEAVRKGVELPLPPEIEAGIKDVSKRGGWNKPAPESYTLPTEIWREVVARRKRYHELFCRLSGGLRSVVAEYAEATEGVPPIHDINDLITLNLDIVQFAQDVVENAEPDLLNAFYKALKAITVLDPTCGSGAFLFAALNILYPLYEACLNRMRVFVEDWQRVGDKTHRNYAKWFAGEIKAVEEDHPNQRYFILKTIILNNLYGVDIMKEATEICRLRLFLKLAAQVEPNSAKPNLGIEPLPDIDFNIRAGNTLVGFATAKEAEDVIRQDLLAYNTVWPEIREKTEDAARHYRMFKNQQTKHGGEVTADDKKALSDKFNALEDTLNRYLATDYGIGARKKKGYQAWIESHRPFHWFVEFHGIMSDGGFDVIIGNPPWKEISALKDEYSIRNYTVEKSGNLYAVCTERSLGLLAAGGSLSFIVQLPIVGASRMISLREYLLAHSDQLTLMPCDDRPGKLFDGLQHCRSCVFVASKPKVQAGSRVYTTRYNRWPTESRNTLFQTVDYVILRESVRRGVFPKLAGEIHAAICDRLFSHKRVTLAKSISKGPTDHFIFYQEATQYWVKATVGLPYYAKNGTVAAPAHGRYLHFPGQSHAYIAHAILNSSLFYTHFIAYGDCFHLSDTLARSFPVPSTLVDDRDLTALAHCLCQDLERHATRTRISTKDGDKIEYAEFNVSESKPIIDEIDRVLAKHYGFTDEELDFIINYDIKYRMGLSNEDMEEGGDQ